MVRTSFTSQKLGLVFSLRCLGWDKFIKAWIWPGVKKRGLFLLYLHMYCSTTQAALLWHFFSKDVKDGAKLMEPNKPKSKKLHDNGFSNFITYQSCAFDHCVTVIVKRNPTEPIENHKEKKISRKI